MPITFKGSRSQKLGYTLVGPEGPPEREIVDVDEQTTRASRNWHVLHGNQPLPLAHFEVARVTVKKRGLGSLLEIKPVGRNRVRGVSFAQGSGALVNEKVLAPGTKGTIRQGDITVKFKTD